MAAFCLVVLVFGDDLMRLLYPGSEYQGNAHTLVVLALAATVAAASAPASVALASVERARALATITAGTAVLTIILVWVMMTEWGLLGAAYGLLTSELLGSIARWLLFLLLVPESAAPGPDRPAIEPATRADCSRKGDRLQEGLCPDATPIVTTAAAVDKWSTQSNAAAGEESGAGRNLARLFRTPRSCRHSLLRAAWI